MMPHYSKIDKQLLQMMKDAIARKGLGDKIPKQFLDIDIDFEAWFIKDPQMLEQLQMRAPAIHNQTRVKPSKRYPQQMLDRIEIN